MNKSTSILKLHLRSDTLTWVLNVCQFSLSQYPYSRQYAVFVFHWSVGWETVTGADHKPQLPPDKPVQVKTCSCCSAQRPLLYHFNWENWRRSKDRREDLASEVTGQIRDTFLSEVTVLSLQAGACSDSHCAIQQHANKWLRQDVWGKLRTDTCKKTLFFQIQHDCYYLKC